MQWARAPCLAAGDDLTHHFGLQRARTFWGKNRAWRRAVFLNDLDHLRDHVAGTLDRHGVADPHTEPLDLILVVQGRVLSTTPPTVIGSSLATGVSAPVRPT